MSSSDNEARALNALLGLGGPPVDGYRASNVELDDLTNGYSGGDLAPLDDDLYADSGDYGVDDYPEEHIRIYTPDSMHDTNEELRGER